MIIKSTPATEEQTFVEVVISGLMDEAIQKILQKLYYYNKYLLSFIENRARRLFQLHINSLAQLKSEVIINEINMV